LRRPGHPWTGRGLGALLISCLVCLAPLLARAGECAEPASASDLRQALGSVEAAFSAQDVQGVHQAVERARSSVACLGEPLMPEDAVHIHRVEALVDFLERDLAGVVLHYRSVLRLEPEYVLPSAFAPDGGPLQQQFELARSAPPAELRDVPVPLLGSVLVDGVRADAAPRELPLVVQHLDARGAVRLSVLLEPGDPWPESLRPPAPMSLSPGDPASAASPDGSRPAVEPSVPPKGRERRVGLLVGSGVALAGSGTLLALAISEKQAFEELRGQDFPTTQGLDRAAAADPHITRNHRYLGGAGVLGAVGLMLGVGGLF